jgi:hypothetical protein
VYTGVEQTECSETSAYKIQTPGNCPEENKQQIQFPTKAHLTQANISSFTVLNIWFLSWDEEKHS